jgi:tRNA modification GTPase
VLSDLDVTLVAVGTPPGRGAIGCLRLTGAEAEPIARRLFRPASLRRPTDGGPCFGRFLDRAGRPIDHGFLVIFPASRAYTGEASAELWSHGSPAVLGELVAAAMAAGARPAGPGEFTYRALRNGRIDLTRAEAIRDLIQARTSFQARVAFSQAEGALARRLAPLRRLIEDTIARAEAAIEFVDEAETDLPRDAVGQAAQRARSECRQLLAAFECGRVARNGAVVAITGVPNVGKSSIFNRLLGRDRSIVTDIPGTTRDTVEAECEFRGIPARLIDTAGLREPADPIEAEGVRRAEAARGESDLVVVVLDRTRAPDRLEQNAIEHARAAPGGTVVVANKSDLPRYPGGRDGIDAIEVSALTGDGLDTLRDAISVRLRGTEVLEDPILTNARHAEAVRQATIALDAAWEGSRDGLPDELILEDVKLALRHLAEITGEFTTEDVLERIFSTFCIGK